MEQWLNKFSFYFLDSTFFKFYYLKHSWPSHTVSPDHDNTLNNAESSLCLWALKLWTISMGNGLSNNISASRILYTFRKNVFTKLVEYVCSLCTESRVCFQRTRGLVIRYVLNKRMNLHKYLIYYIFTCYQRDCSKHLQLYSG